MFKKVLKWIGIILGGFIGLLVLASKASSPPYELESPLPGAFWMKKCPGRVSAR